MNNEGGLEIKLTAAEIPLFSDLRVKGSEIPKLIVCVYLLFILIVCMHNPHPFTISQPRPWQVKPVLDKINSRTLTKPCNHLNTADYAQTLMQNRRHFLGHRLKSEFEVQVYRILIFSFFFVCRHKST